MGDGIDQRAIVVLAVDLHERRADRPQHLHAHRLIVDEGACASVRNLDATQNQVTVDVDIGLGRNEASRVIDRAIEHGGDLALRFPVPNEASIAAPAERQRESIEQDRFARARLAREDGQTPMEMQLELVDEDDVANRKLDQHGG